MLPRASGNKRQPIASIDDSAKPSRNSSCRRADHTGTPAAKPRENEMGSRTIRSVVSLAGAAVLTAGLTACGGGDNGGGSRGGGGQTLHMPIRAKTQHPGEFAAWQNSSSDRCKAQTGATVQFETFASANDELTKIQTSVVSGTGPDLYAVGT